jgi:hypothetical protein
MPVKLGTSTVSKAYLGATEVIRAYRGSSLVLGSAPGGGGPTLTTFNGTSDGRKHTAPYSGNVSALSVHLLLRIDAAGADKKIVGQWTDNQPNGYSWLIFQPTAGTIGLAIRDSGNNYIVPAGATFSAGTLRSVVLTIDTSGATLYSDNTAIRTAAMSLPIAASTALIALGCGLDGTSGTGHSAVSIANYGLWSSVLSSGDIAALAAGSAVSTVSPGTLIYDVPDLSTLTSV